MKNNVKNKIPKGFEWLLEVKDSVISDTETTTLNTGYYRKRQEDGSTQLILSDEKDACSIIEIAGLTFDDVGFKHFYSDINKPQGGTIVSPIASATHGYTNKQLKNAVDFEETNSFRMLRDDLDSGKWLIFHNAPFDTKMLDIHEFQYNPDKVIDTLRVCKHLYADGLIGLADTEFFHIFSGESPENHQLQYFRFLFEMDDQPYFQVAMDMCGLTEVKPHTALSDVFILWIFTAKLMHDFELTLEDMALLSAKPFLEKEFKLGKFRAEPKTYDEIIHSVDYSGSWSNPGYDYFMWVKNNMNLDVDKQFTLNHYMALGILDGTVPFEKTKKGDFTEFLYKAIVTSFNEEQIEAGLEIIGGGATFERISTVMVAKMVDALTAPEPEFNNSDEKTKALAIRESREFFLNYITRFRLGDKRLETFLIEVR